MATVGRKAAVPAEPPVMTTADVALNMGVSFLESLVGLLVIPHLLVVSMVQIV